MGWYVPRVMSDPSRAGSSRQFPAALGAAAGCCLVFAALLGSSLPQETRESASAAGFVISGLAIVVSGTRAAIRSRGRRRRSWALMTSAAGLGLLTNMGASALGIDPVANP